MDLEKRVRKIFDNSEEKPDVILLKNASEPNIDDNFFYVTGLEKGLFEGCFAILYQDGNIDLIVSELEAESARKADVNIKVYKNERDITEYLNEGFSNYNNIGLNFNGLSHKDYCSLINKFPNFEFFDVSKSFDKTRLIKDEIEISLIKKACEIVDKTMGKMTDFVHENMYEFELAAEINYLMQKLGADKVAFDTISSFGKNTAEPHYTHGDTQLKNGNFVLCDFGACFRKYNSDITRTFVFGNISDEQRNMYDTVFEAQRIGLDTIKPGVNGKEIHGAVYSCIEKTEFKGRFIHSTGHSLGLLVHDGGVRLSSGYDIELQENMVFTVEPGVYIPGFGGVRIEDDVLITKNGVEVLTKSPKQLIEI